MITRSVRVAVVQAAAVAFDAKASVEKAVTLIHQAAAAGAEVSVFPEAFISGYPRGLDFGAVVGSRSDAGKEMFLRYWSSAIEVPGEQTETLAAAAREAGSHVVVGVVERDGGTLYCTVLFFSPHGGLLGKHRKLMPTGSERSIWGMGDGSTLPVFSSEIGNLTAAICWENYMPLLRTALYQHHVQLWCAPTADAREGWVASMRHIALEGRCFVLSSNQYALRSDYPEHYPSTFADDPATVLSRGGSCIIAPSGTIVAGPCYDGETILYADLDLADTVRGKYDFDVVGHYARPDIFTLHVDGRERVTVCSVDDGIEAVAASD